MPVPAVTGREAGNMFLLFPGGSGLFGHIRQLILTLLLISVRRHGYDTVPVRRLLSDCAVWREGLRPTFSKFAGWLPLLPHIKQCSITCLFLTDWLHFDLYFSATHSNMTTLHFLHYLSSGLGTSSMSACVELRLRLLLYSVCFSPPATLLQLLLDVACRSVMTRRGRVRVIGWKMTAPEACEMGRRPPTWKRMRAGTLSKRSSSNWNSSREKPWHTDRHAQNVWGIKTIKKQPTCKKK